MNIETDEYLQCREELKRAGLLPDAPPTARELEIFALLGISADDWKTKNSTELLDMIAQALEPDSSQANQPSALH